jgi:hypothetical protein
VTDQPTLTQMADAFADVVEAGGLPALAQQLRENPAEVDEAEFAAIAAELRVHPSQLYQAYAWRLAQRFGWVSPMLGRQLEAQGWVRTQ